MSLVYVKEFHDVYTENEEHTEFGPLLQSMRVVDSNGESQMDEDQWEAASMLAHQTFCNSSLILQFLQISTLASPSRRLHGDNWVRQRSFLDLSLIHTVVSTCQMPFGYFPRNTL